MSNKLDRDLLPGAAVVAVALLLLQGLLLAPLLPSLHLLLIMVATIAGILLLLLLAHDKRRAERDREERNWLQALQRQDPSPLRSELSRAALARLLASFQEASHETGRQLADLHRQAHQDQLTGLRNRHGFQRDMTAFLQQEGSQCALLILLRATRLGAINNQRGAQSGDAYLRDLTRLIGQVVSRTPHQIYRISGADFVVFIQPADDIQPHLLGQELKAAFDHYQQLHGLSDTAYAGLTQLRSGQKIEAVLARADLALARAQTGMVNGWALQQHDDAANLHGQQHWKRVLEELLEQERIDFHSQPIQLLNHDMVPYQKIYAHFSGSEGTVLPIETLFAMAQRLDMVLRLEQLLILRLMRQYRAFGTYDSRWGLGLSGNLLQNSTFLIWLDHQLGRDPDTSAHLVIELDEEQLESNLTGARRLFELLRRQGSRSAISGFGKGIGSFNLLRELKPDYIKLAPSLLNELEQDLTNRQFVRMIVDVAHRMGAQVIAEGVEQPGQKQVLQEMYVDGLQGALIARARPLGERLTGETSVSAGSELSR